ncbi:MAG: urea carboxylase [Clostridium sp.]|jgi:urea carboxylase|uniref:urea carboxylase n=1 Tax=Clostridium sp. TaxID=1506 RepID=UPI0025C0D130|nr:urea carboxylase [Clostridium sp.]MCH3964852.1 urea carboxylase [Clostridium sp.]MCI1716653.1 urea carboxylase [Clostridium sp.]MCI1800865.1 urea carboxylase [Clostridium sp.]MCI1814830.1 urea carboxylase [Clostridium sp.]MCI1871612.1 urea carboxylase [Clostridium sp.]
MFKKVLIANRGAIAVRIERTLKKMNIQSAAVYTKADQDSLHVDYADESYYLGDGTVAETYLNGDKIIEIAKGAGAEAIHPGYGFLSENSDFARKCEENKIKFIGPLPEQMELFGLKHSAREIAGRAGVPMLEGTGLLNNVEEAVKTADALGYPVILKSTAGGGGIGMRTCFDEEELKSAYESCSYLARTNFDNAGLFMEKYLQKARHVEVQIFGNQYGEVVALSERDCSVQRRNQKVMEESPAFGISEATKKAMHEAARNIALQVGYRSAGTVEFLYDSSEEKFYFLEVNTRLQVEHGVTEETLNIDLVEWMIKEAAGELKNLDGLVHEPKGFSIQARIYAEDPMRNFAPSAGKLDKVEFSKDARIETWIQDNVVVTPSYDPMLAKIIVKADSRENAIKKMHSVLQETRIYGITTNIDYLNCFINTEDYKKGKLHTHMLDGFSYKERKIEVLDGGVQTTIQDYPARLGYWDVGVPPSGAMDNFSFRIGNRILGNSINAPGIECTLRGGSYKFRDDMIICLTGADMKARLDNNSVPMYEAISVKTGQILELGKAVKGMRTYILVKGGLDVPSILGSASTFALGGFGGHGGRTLKTGDLIHVSRENENGICGIKKEQLYKYEEVWEIGVIPGPHCTTEFLKTEYLEQLTSTEWEVHFNSDRTGVRLIGPAPLWSREDGGEAGLHPSNVHDTAYAVGTIDLTGDMPIILGPDGPSLGGFVCPVTIPSGELWKIGQLSPGNKVKFYLISIETAEKIRREQEQYLENITMKKELELPELVKTEILDCTYPILKQIDGDKGASLCIRVAGDEYILVEYGEMKIEMRLRIRIHALMELVKQDKKIPLIDTTPGIRSLQIHVDSTKMSIRELSDEVVKLDRKIGDLSSFKIKSRRIKMPLSWNDPGAQLAVDRYYQNVRPDAPWCPSNIEFIRRINGLDSIEKVKEILYSATYLVMGLGDVYLGAPVCIPLDPRQRLVTTKYNPARTWTPENAVGIGGAYMGIYGMEGPGGYQLVGRTIQTWNPIRTTKSFKEGKPWLLNFFDQIQFYPVSAEELLQIRENFLRGRYEVEIEDTVFDYGEYLKYLESIENEEKEFKKRQVEFFNMEKQMWKDKGLDKFVSQHDESSVKEQEIPEGAIPVYSNMPGSVWKILVHAGDRIKKGDPIIIEESMKMEFPQNATCDGVIQEVYVKETQNVSSGQILVTIG